MTGLRMISEDGGGSGNRNHPGFSTAGRRVCSPRGTQFRTPPRFGMKIILYELYIQLILFY